MACSRHLDSPTGARFLVRTVPCRQSYHSTCCASPSTPSQDCVPATRHEIESYEHCAWDFGISPRWGFASFSLRTPGRRCARPGLSNLAPMGLLARWGTRIGYEVGRQGASNYQAVQSLLRTTFRAWERDVGAGDFGLGRTDHSGESHASEEKRTLARSASEGERLPNSHISPVFKLKANSCSSLACASDWCE